MDHRCLYGHRVPAAFTFAIQSRSCPTCGAPTVTVTGYQAARKLTTEVGLEAVAAFSAIRVLEAEWVLTPVTADPAGAPAAVGAALAGAPVAAAAPEEDEVVVVDEPAPAAPPAAAAPETAAKAQEPPKPPRTLARPEPRIVAQPPPLAPAKIEPAARPADVPPSRNFDNAEEDFFKQT